MQTMPPIPEEEDQVNLIQTEIRSSPPPFNFDRPSPSRPSGEHGLNMNDGKDGENDNENDTQNTNATSCVEDTQFTGIELDTQAPEDQPSQAGQGVCDEANGKVQEAPSAMAPPTFVKPQVPQAGPAAPAKFISRQDGGATMEEIMTGFKFQGYKNPHSGPYITEVAQPSIPSRGGQSRSSADMRQPQNAPQQTGRQGGSEMPTRTSAAKDHPQKQTPSEANGAKSYQQVAQGLSGNAIMGDHATQPKTSSSRTGAPLIPPTQQALPNKVPTPPTPQQQKDGPKKTNKAKKNPPFPDVARESHQTSMIQNTPVEGREERNRRDLDGGRENSGMQRGRQAAASLPGDNQQPLPNLGNHQEAQTRGNGIERHEAQGQSARNNEAARVVHPQESRRTQTFQEMDYHSPDSDLPNTLDPRQSRVPQNSARQVVRRPMPAAQLQPEETPHRSMDKSRGVTKASKTRPAKSVTSEISDRNVMQKGPVNAKPTSWDILQMGMFLAQKEKEQSQQTELQVQDQQSKLDQLINENFALRQQIGSLREEKCRLDKEFIGLRAKSEKYKTHMNDVTRSQKHLQDLIKQSDDKQAQLRKDIETREKVALEQVKEARVEVESARAALAPQLEKNLKEARHQIEKMELLRGQLYKDLIDKTEELQRERGRGKALQKKVDEHEPKQKALFQKLQEHFDKVNQQLSGHEGKISTIASAEETNNSKFDECLTILNTIKDKEMPEPPDLGELTKMVENLATRLENRLTSDGETQSNLREAGKELLNDLKNRIEAVQTDQKVQEDLNNRIITLSGANAGLTEKIQTLEHKLAELVEEHSSLKSKYATAKEDLKAALALPKEDPSTQKQLQELKDSKESLLSQVDTISKEAASAKEELTLQQNKTKSDQEQADMLRNKLRDAESLIGGFNQQKREYELAKNEEYKKLRTELENTLAKQFRDQALQNENDKLGLKRAKANAAKELDSALAKLENTKVNLKKAEADLVESKESCMNAKGETDQLRAKLESAEKNKDEQASEIRRLQESLDSVTDRHDSIPNELQSVRDEISQCRQLITERGNQAAKSIELVEKTRDEALQGLKNAEEHAETEIGKLKEQIVKMQEEANKSKKLEENVAKLQAEISKSKKLEGAFDRYLKRRDEIKGGQDLHEWAKSQETQADQSTPRSGPRVTFQETPLGQRQNPILIQSSDSNNAPQTHAQSSRSNRPRIAERKATNLSQNIVNPTHMSGLNDMLMQRTEITEFSVRTSKTYESHRNTPNRVASSAPESQGMEDNSAMRSARPSSISSPMTDLEPLFSSHKLPETGRGMEKALKKQRDIKAPPKNPEKDGTTIIPTRKPHINQSEESNRRRELQAPKSALKRKRSTNNPQNSEAQSSSQSDDILMPSTAKQGQAKALVDMLAGKSTNTTPSSGRQLQPGFGKAPYNRIVSGNGASKQQQNATATSSKNSGLDRQLSAHPNAERNLETMTRRGSTGMVTRSASNEDDHPAKIQRTSQPIARKPSRSVIPDSQGDSQFSAYNGSQNF